MQGISYNYRFQLQSLCDNKLVNLDGYNSFTFVDLPIFRYFLALKSYNGIYFFSRQSIDEKSRSSELKKLQFVGETFGNGHGKAALLEFKLLPVGGTLGMHVLHSIGSPYKLVAHAKEDRETEFSLSDEDKNIFFAIIFIV